MPRTEAVRIHGAAYEWAMRQLCKKYAFGWRKAKTLEKLRLLRENPEARKWTSDKLHDKARSAAKKRMAAEHLIEFDNLRRMRVEELKEERNYVDGKKRARHLARLYRKVCPTCGAGQWKPCRTASGAWVPPHRTRVPLGEDEGLTVACDVCGSAVGMKCRRPRGEVAPTHRRRLQAVAGLSTCACTSEHR